MAVGKETLPRRIPETTVLLDEQIRTKVDQSLSTFDRMADIFKSRQKSTLHSSVYSTRDANQGSAAETGGNIERKTPITLVEALRNPNGTSFATIVSMFGRAILRPTPLIQPTYLLGAGASTASYPSADDGIVIRKFLDQGGCTTSPSPAETTKKVTAEITEQLRKTREQTSEVTSSPVRFQIAAAGCGSLVDGQVLRTWETHCWKTDDPQLMNEMLANNANGIRIVRNRVMFDDIPNRLRAKFESCFVLKPNQPYCFSFQSSGTMPSEYTDHVRGGGAFPKEAQQFYKDDMKQNPALEVQWGGGDFEFKVIYRAGAEAPFTVFRKVEGKWREESLSNQISMDTLSSGGHKFQQVTVYPLGNKLIFFFGYWGSGRMLEEQSSYIQFSKDIVIPESKITAHFYGGKGAFSFFPITHEASGILVSPTMSPGYRPNVAWPILSYFGRTKVGRDDPIEPGIDTSIKTINFPQPESQNLQSDIGRVTTKHLGGEIRIQYQMYTAELTEDLLVDSIGEEDQRIAAKKFPQVDIGGSGGDNILVKWAIRLENLNGAVERRIYSPIVDWIQMNFIPPDTLVPLSPNPQIDFNDIKVVTINEAVQQISASVVLDNRQNPGVNKAAEEGGGGSAIGKYTMPISRDDKGRNFIGIKPITIRVGIKDDFKRTTSDRDQQQFALNGYIIGDARRITDSARTYKGFGEAPVPPAFGQEQPIHFRGFIVSRDYSRPHSAKSECTLTCEDVSRRAKDHLTANLPIFDGWCNLAVMYYLLRDAGYQDDEILMFQDRLDPTKQVTLRKVLEDAGSDPDTFSGGCFDGHVDGFPNAVPALENLPGGISIKVPGPIIHAAMPLAGFSDNPNYMFQMGQNTWDCCQSTREFTGFYLYPNAFGNMIYQPAEVALLINSPSAASPQADHQSVEPIVGGGTSTAPGGGGGGGGPSRIRFKFFEISRRMQSGEIEATAYSQYQRKLNAVMNTQESRNALAIVGLLPIEERNGIITDWAAHITTKKLAEGKIEEAIDNPAFAPWLKWAIIKNPHWNNAKYNQYLSEQYFARLTRPLVNVSFSAWGQEGLFAYEVIELDESIMNETGIDKCLIVVTSITHQLDAAARTWYSDIQGELIQTDTFDFSPHVWGYMSRTQSPGPRSVPTPTGKQ